MTMKGLKHSPETRAKIGAANIGKHSKPRTAEQRAKQSEAMKGKPGPNKGKKFSPESRAKMAAAQRGRKHSDETKRKIAAASTGRVKLGEERRKLSEARVGKPLSAETCAKLSAAKKGKPKSAEWRAKLGNAKRGERNPAWLGGVSFEPYCVKFNKEFKERVREFFGRQCVECGAPENGVRLCVHHVNFRKDSCCAEGVVPLFVPLCPSCHAKTNYNRDYWEIRFTALINEQHGGRCYLPKVDTLPEEVTA